MSMPPRAGDAALPVIDKPNLVQSIVTAIQQTLSVIQEIQVVAQQGTHIAQQVQQLEHELAMLENMAANTRPAGTVAWADVDSALGGLARAVQTGLAVSYALSDVGDVFERRFPGYQPPRDWPTAYDSWSTSVLDTLRGTLASAGLNVADAPSVEAALAGLRTANESAEGRLQVLQIGNQIASLQVEELAKLRQLHAAQISAQNAYLGAQEAKAAGSAAAFDAWVANAPSAIPVSRPAEGLGAVPRP
jgi:P-type conjugative transfer protein TrbJ